MSSRLLLAAPALLALACRTAPPAAGPAGAAPVAFPFQNPDLPLETRVADLVGRMTLEEKAGQVQFEAPASPRLGVPAYHWWNEALHGVAGAGRATVFPQAIGLAATWDTALMYRVATAIAVEARAKHHEAARGGRRGIFEGLTFWSPNINIVRDPRYLRTVATAKHFAVHSGPEPERHRFDAQPSEHDLRETYLPAFEASVVEGGARSVMCAYNRVRGDPACASPLLLHDILRGEWHFGGYVVSDCWAISDIHTFHHVAADEVEAAAKALRAGTDLSCGPEYRSLVPAIGRGLVTRTALDSAVTRLFRERFRLGMFDPPERVPYTAIPYSENESPEHGELALEAARKSIVLLRNADDVLPLRGDLGTIAVIGPDADDAELLRGNYNGLPSATVTPLAGIRRAVSSRTQVLYARGSELAENTPSFEVVPAGALSGLTAEYFANQGFSGEPFATRSEPVLDHTWMEGPPLPGMPADFFAVRWTASLRAPAAGRYALGLRALGGARLYLDDSLVVAFANRFTGDLGWVTLDLAAGQERHLRVEYFDVRPDALVQLLWAPPRGDLRAEAVAAARRADAVVMVLGLSPRLEGEEMRVEVPGFAGGDRTSLDLPAPQEALLEAVVATGKPVVLVLLSGSALAVNWAAEHVPAILEAWYPGQAAGTAIADVLFGAVNPGARLPVTFYRSADQLPPFTDYGMDGRTYKYFRGEPLFPFGHGLSYTRWRYRDLRVPARVRAGETVEVSVEVENAGPRAGEEVVQVYVSHPGAPVAAPIRALEGFTRVGLAPGERRRITFRLSPRQMSIVDPQGRWIEPPGAATISVGGKQPGFHGNADAATTEVVTAPVVVTP